MARRVRSQGRAKRKNKVNKSKAPTPQEIAYENPGVAFITAFPPITLIELAKVTGRKLSTLRNMSTANNWHDKREAYLQDIEQRAMESLKETAASKIVEANKRHINIGKASQGLGAKLFTKANKMLDEPDPDIKPGEAVRSGTAAVKAGVDIERKGLGLADQVMYVQGVREFASVVMIVLQQHLGASPDILGNVVDDIKAKLQLAEQKSAQVIDAE